MFYKETQTDDFGNYTCYVSNGIPPEGVAHVTLTIGGNQRIYCSALWHT